MCYEFTHHCDDMIIGKIAVIGSIRYFMVCIGNHNYLFSDTEEDVEQIRVLLFVENVAMHVIPEDELYDVLTVPETIAYQKFHGDQDLYQSFISRNKSS